MTQLANIVLTDSVAANHTFKPRDSAGGVATLVESTGVPIGDRKLTLSVIPTPAGRYKFTAKLQVPIVQDVVVNGVSKPTIVRIAYGEITFNTAPEANTAERADLTTMMRDLLTEGIVWDMSVGLESAY